MTIKIVVWNARGWTNKKEEMTKRLYDNDIDIGIITELKGQKNIRVKISGYNVISQQNNNLGIYKSGGVAII